MQLKRQRAYEHHSTNCKFKRNQVYLVYFRINNMRALMFYALYIIHYTIPLSKLNNTHCCHTTYRTQVLELNNFGIK